MTYFEIDRAGDWIRLGVAIFAFIGLIQLSRRFTESKGTWNTKTRDYWFSLVCWMTASLGAGIQGIILNPEFTPVTVLLVLATLFTVLGLSRRGDWGNLVEK